ncbi:MAG TPA: hypothetical protein VFI22_14710, partial [Thermomicrobiales bacterium]|nr:hypothetical protein [Thermomicrobiales bacterium]
MSQATTAPDRASVHRASPAGGACGRSFDRRRAVKLTGAALLAPLLTACGAMPPSGPASPAPAPPGTPGAPPATTAAAVKQGITIGDLAARV